MKELINNFFAFGIIVALDKVILFTLLPLYTRVFTVSQFGCFDLVQTFAAVISVFAFLQLETSLQRYYYTEKDRGKFIFSILVTVFFIGIFLALIGSYFSKKISFILLNDVSYTKIIVLALIQIPFEIVLTINTIILRYEKQNKNFLTITLLRSGLLILLVFLLIFQYNVLGVFIAQFITVIITSILSFFYIKPYLVFTYSIPSIKKSFDYAMPQFPARLGSTANSHANRFIINGYMSTLALGIFSMALKLSSIVSLFHSVFMMAWNQFMFQIINNKKHKELFVLLFAIISPILFFIVSCLALFSYELIYYLMTPDYIAAYKYVGTISLSLAFIICKEIVDIGPKYLEKTRYLSINFFISVIVNIASLLILVPMYGLLGAVISLLTTNLTLLIVSWYNSNKIYPINFSVRKFILSLIPVSFIIILIYLDIIIYQLIFKISLLFFVSAVYFFMTFKAIEAYRKFNIQS